MSLFAARPAPKYDHSNDDFAASQRLANAEAVVRSRSLISLLEAEIDALTEDNRNLRASLQRAGVEV